MASPDDPTPYSKPKGMIEFILSITTLLGVAFAVFTYLYDRYLNLPEITVGHPTVIELRCSSLTYSVDDCYEKSGRQAYLSVTGAFPVSVEGDAQHTAMFDGATAVVSLDLATNNVPKPPYEFSSFWYQNITGGKNEPRQQVTSLTLHGGESFSREIWFMPLPAYCAKSATSACGVGVERQEFVPWRDFVGGLLAGINDYEKKKVLKGTAASDENLKKLEASAARLKGVVEFDFKWRARQLKSWYYILWWIGNAEIPKKIICNFSIDKTFEQAIWGEEFPGLIEPSSVNVSATLQPTFFLARTTCRDGDGQ